MTEPLAWTVDMVRYRLWEALSILRRSASVARKPSERVTYWPDAPNTSQEAYGYTPSDPDEVAAFARPSSAEITRMDEVFRWVSLWLGEASCAARGLAPDAGWVAVKQASGWPLPRIAKARRARWGVVDGGRAHRGQIPGGNHRHSLERMVGYVHAYLVAMLTQARIEADAPIGDELVVGLDPGPGAMPRVMAVPMPLKNPRPCGECRLYAVSTPGGKKSICTRFHIQVAPQYSAWSPPGACCWEQRAPGQPAVVRASRAAVA
jgi:hypothetical protein